MSETENKFRYGPDNPSEAQQSLARYIREVKGYPLSDADCSAAFTWHGEWQSSPERHAERATLGDRKKAAALEAAEARKAEVEARKAIKEQERESKRAEREAEAEKKAEARKLREAEREAKKAEREAEAGQKEEQRAVRSWLAAEKRFLAESERARKQAEREAARAAKAAEREAKSDAGGADGDDSTAAPANGEGGRDRLKRIRRRSDESVAAGVSEASF